MLVVVVDVVLPLLRQESQSICSKSNHVKIFDVVENIYRSYHDRIVDIYNYDEHCRYYYFYDYYYKYEHGDQCFLWTWVEVVMMMIHVVSSYRLLLSPHILNNNDLYFLLLEDYLYH